MPDDRRRVCETMYVCSNVEVLEAASYPEVCACAFLAMPEQPANHVQEGTFKTMGSACRRCPSFPPLRQQRRMEKPWQE